MPNTYVHTSKHLTCMHAHAHTRTHTRTHIPHTHTHHTHTHTHHTHTAHIHTHAHYSTTLATHCVAPPSFALLWEDLSEWSQAWRAQRTSDRDMEGERRGGERCTQTDKTDRQTDYHRNIHGQPTSPCLLLERGRRRAWSVPQVGPYWPLTSTEQNRLRGHSY